MSYVTAYSPAMSPTSMFHIKLQCNKNKCDTKAGSVCLYVCAYVCTYIPFKQKIDV